MDMGEKIKSLRLEKGLTLEELGEKVGVGKSTVRKWENGIIANMRRDKIAKIADALNTTPAYLMGWEEGQTSDEASHAKARMLMDPQFIKLFSYWEQLSEEGKQKLKDYIDDLYKIYKK